MPVLEISLLGIAALCPSSNLAISLGQPLGNGIPLFGGLMGAFGQQKLQVRGVKGIRERQDH